MPIPRLTSTLLLLMLARPSLSGLAPPTQAGPWFVDVAPRSSFPYKTNNDYTGRKYCPQPMAAAFITSPRPA